MRPSARTSTCTWPTPRAATAPIPPCKCPGTDRPLPRAWFFSSFFLQQCCSRHKSIGSTRTPKPIGNVFLPSFSYFTEFRGTLPSFTELYRVSRNFTEFHEIYRVSRNFIEFHGTLPSFTELYRVSRNFTEFHGTLPSFTATHSQRRAVFFYRVSRRLRRVAGFCFPPRTAN